MSENGEEEDRGEPLTWCTECTDSRADRLSYSHSGDNGQRLIADGGQSDGEIDRGDSPDAGGIVRLSVDDWAEAKVVMSGTSEKVEGDGLTQRLDSLQPGENAVAEVAPWYASDERFEPSAQAQALIGSQLG